MARTTYYPKGVREYRVWRLKHAFTIDIGEEYPHLRKLFGKELSLLHFFMAERYDSKEEMVRLILGGRARFASREAVEELHSFVEELDKKAGSLEALARMANWAARVYAWRKERRRWEEKVGERLREVDWLTGGYIVSVKPYGGESDMALCLYSHEGRALIRVPLLVSPMGLFVLSYQVNEKEEVRSEAEGVMEALTGELLGRVKEAVGMEVWMLDPGANYFVARAALEGREGLPPFIVWERYFESSREERVLVESPAALPVGEDKGSASVLALQRMEGIHPFVEVPNVERELKERLLEEEETFYLARARPLKKG